jgi:hypothetical protein
MEYHVGKFIVFTEADASEPEFPALVIGVEQKITVVTPNKEIRTFTTKDFDDEFLNEDGTKKDIGDKTVTDVFLNKKVLDWRSNG